MGRKAKSHHRSKSLDSHLVSIQKTKFKRKNSKRKNLKISKNTFKEIFNKSHNESESESSMNTVIEINSTTQENIPLSSDAENNNEVDPIVIDDDDLTINNEPCPLQCSTPLPKSNANLNLHEKIENLTKEINQDSYLTIDLTTESLNETPNTVIDLDASDSLNLSMSGTSDITVINMKKNKSKVDNQKIKKFAKGIAKLGSSEKGKLLKFIAKNILKENADGSSACSLHSLKNGINQATDTESAFIKQVILGQSSRNSIGSNIYNPDRDLVNTGLRMIIIDGSNVAMEHTKGRIFSVKGLKICIDYFVNRGHVVRAFVPQFRCRSGMSTNGQLLGQLERKGLVVYTPSREVKGKTITPYDDRYVIQCAAEFDGVIVSNDNYRDLLAENKRWRYVIENRLLQFTWVNDMIMFPKDPLGRHGPTLEEFLKHPDTKNIPVIHLQ